MARKRMISPEIWDSENFSKLSVLAKLIFIGMFSNADDEGRGRAKAAFLKSKLFPYDDSMRVADIEAALDEVAANMSVTIYSHDGNEYYSFDNWNKWQRVDKPSPSSIRPFGEECEIIRGMFGERSANAHRTFPPNRKEEKRKKVKRTEEEKKAPPAAVPQEIVDVYQNNIAPITPIVLESLSDWLKSVDADVVDWAIREAAEHNKRSWKYIEAIIRNHFNAGRTTLAAVQLANRSYKNGADKQASVFDDGGTDFGEIERMIQAKG